MKQEPLLHFIGCAREEVSYSNRAITGQKGDLILKATAVSSDQSLLMNSSVIGQIQPQFFIQRNMGYEDRLSQDMYGENWQNGDSIEHQLAREYDENLCRCMHRVNTKRFSHSVILVESMNRQADPCSTHVLSQRNGIGYQHCGTPKRSRASSTDCCTVRVPNSDSTDSESDHVVVSVLNRPSREVLALEYPDLVLPSSRVCNYSRLGRFTSDLDIKCLDVAYNYLKQSGWYYGPFTMGEAREKLKSHPVGTFLLRDSSDPNYLFSLSVKTRRGTTSIRIVYEKGRFRMDADARDKSHVTSFDCVMKLIGSYVTKTSQQEENDCILVETNGRMDTPLVVSQGCKTAPGRLKHLCRVALNKSLTEEQRRRLLIFMPPDIEHYMKGYPFIV